jgi:acyl-CoA thioesterase FadM
MPQHHVHALRIDVDERDLPEDRFTDHVNNARYFAFTNRCFLGWYRAMGIRGDIPGFAAFMVRLEYDFLREVKPPSVIECRIQVERVGRTSLEHSIAISDLGVDGTGSPVPVGRGRAVNVWVERATGRAVPWPRDVVARCWTVPAEGHTEPSSDPGSIAKPQERSRQS